MKNINHKKLLVVAFLIAVTGCSNAPGQSELKKQVLPTLGQDISMYAEIVEPQSISKTNGRRIDDQTYVIYFNYEVVAKRNLSFSKNGNDNTMVENFAVSGLFRSCGSIRKGYGAVHDGSATFIKTENGWVLATHVNNFAADFINSVVKCEMK